MISLFRQYILMAVVLLAGFTIPSYAQSQSGNMTDPLQAESQAALINSTVTYYDGAQGYLVYPSDSTQDKLPGVIMIHEWWGLNDNIRDMADTLASRGYVVLAADLYNGEVASDPARARELSGSVRDNPQDAINNLKAGVNYLSMLDNVNGSKIASLGWCFGGGQSLQLALNSEDHPLAATVIYYGNLVTDKDQLSKIKWPVQGIFGAEDSSIPVATVEEFKEGLDSLGIPNEIHIYEGVGHAFANPSGDNYSEEQATNAWDRTVKFLDRYL